MMTDEQRKDALISNGLYTTSKMLLRSIKKGYLSEQDYIEEMRALFVLYEKMRGEE